jgi:N6-L-threonylcarbamoyladenine synthase
MKILAIETSCDDTSVAILQDRQLLSLQTMSQKDHEAFGGVFPELASRLHTETLSLCVEKVLLESGCQLHDIDAIAVTAGPGLIGSLHIGVITAKTLAYLLKKPLIGVHHLAAHIEAASFHKPIVYPCLALIVSGGHTMLVRMEKPLTYTILGQTQDDAVGEAYDKVARLLNLPYPGGPHLDELAQIGKQTIPFTTPTTQGVYDFSYSGLKSQVIQRLQQSTKQGINLKTEDIAASFQEVAMQTLIDKTYLATQDFQYASVVIAGGVAANKTLRAKAKDLEDTLNIPVIFPPLWACMDNAAMIGLLAFQLIERQQLISLDHRIDPNWSFIHFMETK